MKADEGRRRLRIIVSGSHGLVGQRLCKMLEQEGHTVLKLVRRKPRVDTEIYWQPDEGEIDAEQLEGADAVVHLAGENIAARKWSQKQKNYLRTNRQNAGRLLSQTLAGLKQAPEALLVASAVGYYGNVEQVVDEKAPAGTNFPAEVCQLIEKATAPAEDKGVRAVYLRFGVILSPDGGALARLLTPFKLGFGGRLGNGKQPFCWVSREDACRAIYHCLMHTNMEGPINITSPECATNASFTRALGKVLRRPTILPMPAFMVKFLFGEMGDELLLKGVCAAPAKLTSGGFGFNYAKLEEALRYEMNQSKKGS